MNRLRRVAVLGILLVPLLSGCAFANPEVASASWSRAGVGVNIEGVGPLEVRNVLIVAIEDGSAGNLILAAVNNTDVPHVLDLEIGEGSDAEVSIQVGAESTVSFGQRPSLDAPPLLEGLDATPGSMVPITFAVGADQITRSVPVLDGCLPYLNGLEPGDRVDECPALDNEVG